MARSFVSGNPRIDLGSLSVLSEATALSVATWIKLDNTSRDNAIVVRGSLFSSSAPLMFWRDDVGLASGRTNTLSVVVATDAGSIRSEGAADLLNDTDWHHIAMVFEAGVADGLRLYVDGQKDSNYTTTVGHAKLVADTSDVTIGFDDSNKQFTGRMAEFAVGNTALSDSEVAQLAAGFSPLTLPAAVDRLVVYQDLIRGLNRPGIGPTATSSGTFANAEHPRLFVPHGCVAHVSPAQSLVVGPHRLATGEGAVVGNETGAVFVSGAASGALTPTGEVYS